MPETLFVVLLTAGTAAFGLIAALRLGRAAAVVIVRGRDD